MSDINGLDPSDPKSDGYMDRLAELVETMEAEK